MKRVGVIGGGQLAWMMADAAEKLGLELVVQTPNPDDPAVKIAKDAIFAKIDDAVATAELATRCDLVTFENEFVDLEALKPLVQQGVCFRPSLEALSALLDKYHQHRYLRDIGLPVPQFAALAGNLLPSEFNFPTVLKVRRHGYDGQGTFILKSQEELEATCQRLQGLPVMLEAFVPFERELAIIAARNPAGEVAIYPVVETQQENQVCHRVFVPADIAPEVSLQVEAIARTLVEQLQLVGVLGIELFLTQEGKVLVNEIAPRTHNSGHYTLDACEISQFEMQLRAVTGLQLGSPALKCAGAVMVNLLGLEHSHHDYQGKRAKLAEIPHAHVHWYGKAESRPGRKLGHITVLLERESQGLDSASVQTTLQQIAQEIESIWYG